MSNTNIKPIGANILLEKPEAKKGEITTKSGIILPQDSGANDKKPETGKIIAIGTHSAIAKKGLKVGQTIMYSKYAGTDFKENDKDYVIVNYKDVQAIIE